MKTANVVADVVIGKVFLADGTTKKLPEIFSQGKNQENLHERLATFLQRNNWMEQSANLTVVC